jgi:DNA-binding NarL/FixJ family response regulator
MSDRDAHSATPKLVALDDARALRSRSSLLIKKQKNLVTELTAKVDELRRTTTALSAKMLELRSTMRDGVERARISVLTSRERQVLSLLARGRSTTRYAIRARRINADS